MNVTVHALPVWVQTSREDAKHVSAAGVREDELAAIWNTIFDGARPLEVEQWERREEQHSSPHTRPLGGGRRSTPTTGGECSAPHASSAMPVPNIPAPGAVATAPAAAVQMAHPDAQSQSVAAVAVPPNYESVGQRAERIASLSPVAVPPRPPLMSVVAAATESVHVHAQGQGVSIVVRDLRVSSDEALRCAFETAAALAGRRAALATLTMNGQCIYRAAAAPRAADCELVFTC